MFAVHLRNPCLVVSGRESNLAEKSEKTNQAVQSAPEFRDVHALLAHYPQSHDPGSIMAQTGLSCVSTMMSKVFSEVV